MTMMVTFVELSRGLEYLAATLIDGGVFAMLSACQIRCCTIRQEALKLHLSYLGVSLYNSGLD